MIGFIIFIVVFFGIAHLIGKANPELKREADFKAEAVIKHGTAAEQIKGANFIGEKRMNELMMALAAEKIGEATIENEKEEARVDAINKYDIYHDTYLQSVEIGEAEGEQIGGEYDWGTFVVCTKHNMGIISNNKTRKAITLNRYSDGGYYYQCANNTLLIEIDHDEEAGTIELRDYNPETKARNYKAIYKVDVKRVSDFTKNLNYERNNWNNRYEYPIEEVSPEDSIAQTLGFENFAELEFDNMIKSLDGQASTSCIPDAIYERMVEELNNADEVSKSNVLTSLREVNEMSGEECQEAYDNEGPYEEDKATSKHAILLAYENQILAKSTNKEQARKASNFCRMKINELLEESSDPHGNVKRMGKEVYGVFCQLNNLEK